MFRLKLTGQDNGQGARDLPKAIVSCLESRLQANAGPSPCHRAGKLRRRKHA